MEVDLSTLLTEDEINFVKLVYSNPGCKLTDGCSKWHDDGTEYGTTVALWKRPEELGVVECVGSYKWIPKNLIVKLFYSA